jgi:hypothetical protein
VAGDTVNLCAKVTATAQPGEIRVTKSALAEFPNRYRFLCRPLGPIPISSTNQPLELMQLSWHDAILIPTLVLIEETGQRIMLPNQPVISLGRIREAHGVRANDIALQLPDAQLTQKISRYHLEIQTHPEGSSFDRCQKTQLSMMVTSSLRGKKPFCALEVLCGWQM